MKELAPEDYRMNGPRLLSKVRKKIGRSEEFCFVSLVCVWKRATAALLFSGIRATWIRFGQAVLLVGMMFFFCRFSDW